MLRYLCRGTAVCMPALLVLALYAAPATAGVTISFRNDTKSPIIVQGIGVIRGRLVQGRPLLVQPGATVSDVVLVPGNKVITIVDAKQPTRTLARETITVGAKSVFFAVEVDEEKVAPGKNKAKKTTKVKLTETLPPTVSPKNPSTPMPRH